MHKKKLNYYSGNYDQYVQTRAELEENQMKRYKWEQEQISHMKVRWWWWSSQEVNLLTLGQINDRMDQAMAHAELEDCLDTSGSLP